MPKLWVTYAWVDNAEQDIDFILHELEKTGELDVRFDRRCLVPGQRLWPQIAGYITDPKECDAWALVVSPGSLSSQPCLEELCFALDRALSSRGVGFPMIGLIYRLGPDQLPTVLHIRLCVLLSDPSWPQQVVAGVHGHGPGYQLPNLPPVIVRRHASDACILIEVRPRLETWTPFRAAVPVEDRDKFTSCWARPPNSPRGASVMTMLLNGAEMQIFDKGTMMFLRGADNPASQAQSYYMSFTSLPSQIFVGDDRKVFDITHFVRDLCLDQS